MLTVLSATPRDRLEGYKARQNQFQVNASSSVSGFAETTFEILFQNANRSHITVASHAEEPGSNRRRALTGTPRIILKVWSSHIPAMAQKRTVCLDNLMSQCPVPATQGTYLG